ncbi:MAG: hypothetical protein B7C55_12015 [Actinomycetales bacterium mxb001]|nr:MAG: hypothetical protein B7C55_12015 [Actinomycetales bacterium mxb001]
MNAALLGDQIVCPNGVCQHINRGPYVGVGTISYCKVSKVLIEGRRPAVVNDRGTCGGPTVLTTGSSRVMIEGMMAHRVGDRNACTGSTTGPGSSRVRIGS